MSQELDKNSSYDGRRKINEDESTPLLIGRDNSVRAVVPSELARRPKLMARLEPSDFFRSWSDSERRRHELHSTHIRAAAFLIRAAVLGNEIENPAEGGYDPYTSPYSTGCDKLRNSVALLCLHWCPAVVKILEAALAVLVALTFLEPPHWCREDYSLPYAGCENFLWAMGVPASSFTEDAMAEEKSVHYYPNTNSSKLVRCGAVRCGAN